MSDENDPKKNSSNPANMSELERDARYRGSTKAAAKIAGLGLVAVLLKLVVMGAIAWGISRLVGLHGTGLIIYWVPMTVLILWMAIRRRKSG